jgi:ribosome assembly protein YihI (activator of Der GTPase)
MKTRLGGVKKTRREVKEVSRKGAGVHRSLRVRDPWRKPGRSRTCREPRYGLAHVVRHVGDYDARFEEQAQAQKHGRLGVEQVVPPAVGHELRHDDGDQLV